MTSQTSRCAILHASTQKAAQDGSSIGHWSGDLATLDMQPPAWCWVACAQLNLTPIWAHSLLAGDLQSFLQNAAQSPSVADTPF